jgi:hypothetical protein
MRLSSSVSRVVAEATYLLARYPKAPDTVLELIEHGAPGAVYIDALSRHTDNCQSQTTSTRERKF